MPGYNLNLTNQQMADLKHHAQATGMPMADVLRLGLGLAIYCSGRISVSSEYMGSVCSGRLSVVIGRE